MSSGILYTAVATAKGVREEHVRSSDGVLDLALTMPTELGGEGGAKTNPEQLFAAGYAACFEGATRLAAREQGLSLGPDTQVTARVGIGPRTQGGFSIAVELEVRLDGLEVDQKSEIVEVAHQKICPYSHATRGNVNVDIRIV
ncbi:organic hydroperoxide resistance protein [Parvibaculum sp.]|uniref:organic hydroperoxide resistance protein n=1 Tax=Parvibaculum sp. TaxID=2024848 RepID=UPI001E1A7294|nr:organic hydroperoxide resistance protein [Parvibaculum sp.]MBX3488707.1 organic hydroperoxide resistance protein [Parvibaculum sp.]MCW5727411.1 organic hydroperoxide resistance protein [Parvibaculum sp.]